MWCIFSVENQYDQPSNNLEAWWARKPSLEMLFEFFRVNRRSAELIVKVTQIWESEGESVRINNTDYRLQKVKEGVILDDGRQP